MQPTYSLAASSNWLWLVDCLFCSSMSCACEVQYFSVYTSYYIFIFIWIRSHLQRDSYPLNASICNLLSDKSNMNNQVKSVVRFRMKQNHHVNTLMNLENSVLLMIWSDHSHVENLSSCFFSIDTEHYPILHLLLPKGLVNACRVDW